MTSRRSALIWIGGAALLVAMATDTLSVLGRLVGLPFRGSIELVQAAVLVAGSVALIAATLADRHARVRLIVDRFAPKARGPADRLSAFFTAIFFAALLAGSAWIALDLWSSHEISETLRLPWRWLRLFANVGLVAVIIVVLRQMLRKRRA
jgi:TRAP-type transport system small permease protein